MAENKDSSDSDSIISSDESEEEMEPKVSIFIVYNCLLIVFWYLFIFIYPIYLVAEY